MRKYYFTFGTDAAFPFGINEFVLVKADSRSEAVSKFSAKYAPRRDGIANCAFIYTEDEFKSIQEKYYRNVVPSDVIE